MAIDDYSVSKSSRTCGLTGRALKPGESCVATLRETQDGQLERVDYALDAWPDAKRSSRFFSMWRTRVPDDDGPRRAFVDDEALVDLFIRLEGETKRERQAFRYVLALVLLRKRLLRFEGRRQEADAEIWLLRPRGTSDGPAMEVADPGLDDADVVAVHEQLGEILHGDLG